MLVKRNICIVSSSIAEQLGETESIYMELLVLYSSMNHKACIKAEFRIKKWKQYQALYKDDKMLCGNASSTVIYQEL